MSNLRQEMTTGLREFHEVRNRTVKLDKGVYTHDAATMKKDMAGSIAVMKDGTYLEVRNSRYISKSGDKVYPHLLI